MTSAWADERVYYPLHLAPYTPAGPLARGQEGPRFPDQAADRAGAGGRGAGGGRRFRAVVSDCAYGESADFEGALWEADLPFVVAAREAGTWAPAEAAHTPKEAAAELRWEGPERPGDWTRVEREFRDGHRETWWAAELTLAGYGPDRRLGWSWRPPTRDPAGREQLVPGDQPAAARLAARRGRAVRAGRPAEVVRLYGLRNWVEQGYKQVKDELGWADFMVRKDRAIRRHWQLVCCAFSFCWWAWSRAPTTSPAPTRKQASPPQRGGGKMWRGRRSAPTGRTSPGRWRCAGSRPGCTPGRALALVARLVGAAPAPRSRRSLTGSGPAARSQAQTASSPVQRLNFPSGGCVARRVRVWRQREAQTSGSRTSVSGWLRLRTTKEGNQGRPVGWPTGW